MLGCRGGSNWRLVGKHQGYNSGPVRAHRRPGYTSSVVWQRVAGSGEEPGAGFGGPSAPRAKRRLRGPHAENLMQVLKCRDHPGIYFIVNPFDSFSHLPTHCCQSACLVQQHRRSEPHLPAVVEDKKHPSSCTTPLMFNLRSAPLNSLNSAHDYMCGGTRQ